MRINDNKEVHAMRDMWESIKDFFRRDWTMSEKVLVILCCVLLGVIKGFFLSPIKKGISFGNNNGNTYVGSEDDDWSSEE